MFWRSNGRGADDNTPVPNAQVLFSAWVQLWQCCWLRSWSSQASWRRHLCSSSYRCLLPPRTRNCVDVHKPRSIIFQKAAYRRSANCSLSLTRSSSRLTPVRSYLVSALASLYVNDLPHLASCKKIICWLGFGECVCVVLCRGLVTVCQKENRLKIVDANYFNV